MQCNYLIIGGGVIGLSIGRELVHRGEQDIIVIEKEPAPGRHASGRNSGVLHAGIYYTPDSFKARFCLKGNLALQQYCRDNNLPLLETKKVIVAKNESELPVLAELLDRALKNGAKAELIDETRLASIEPNAVTRGQALLSHYTATVGPLSVLECIHAELLKTGAARVLTDCAFLGLKDQNTAHTRAGEIRFGRLINAGGAFADVIARAFGLAEDLRLIPFKGAYKKLRPEKSHLVRGNIYPVPDIRNPFLGVHFSKSVDGDVYIGPTATPAFGREKYEGLLVFSGEALRFLYMDAVLFFRNNKFRANAFEEIRKYNSRAFFKDAGAMLRGITPGDIIPAAKVGIRPQLVNWKTKELVQDFLIQTTDTSVHVLNAISPAFTSAFPVAEYVVDEYVL